ncbi:MAG: hypothetical protein J5725_06175 [Bacteroidales bacterium]|nr:hypothetical protein [Bacteroidales bacterium]
MQAIKEYLALYEEVLSYREISRITGYTVEELEKIYNEMFDSGELFKLKEKVTSIMNQGGIVRINPTTFEYKIYTDRADIVKDGFFAQNVVRACSLPETLVSGYLWRWGEDIDDIENIEEEIHNQIPNMFRPIIAENKAERAMHEFESIISASLVGYTVRDVKKAIQCGTKYRGMYWRYK